MVLFPSGSGFELQGLCGHASFWRRFSDFIVNEVDLQGNVVHLTELTVRPEVCDHTLLSSTCSPPQFPLVMLLSRFQYQSGTGVQCQSADALRVL